MNLTDRGGSDWGFVKGFKMFVYGVASQFRQDDLFYETVDMSERVASAILSIYF